MFVRQSKYDTACRDNLVLSVKHQLLLAEYNALVERINDRGGEEFLTSAVIGNENFTVEELKRMVRLCHPDKHNGNKTSLTITKKLNKMIEGMR